MSLTAERPLEADTPEQLLLRAETIRERVKEAKLAGDDPEEELSPEEREMLEEMTMMMGRYGEPQRQPGEPIFFFVARLSPAEREQAMADAFAKAQANAQSLAKAAGMEIGILEGVRRRC